MSAAQPGELRAAMAEALAAVDVDGLRRVAYVGEPQRYGLSRVVDALLPVVTAYAERLARERAAAELRAAAADWPPTWAVDPATYLLDRAAALAADDQPVQP